MTDFKFDIGDHVRVIHPSRSDTPPLEGIITERFGGGTNNSDAYYHFLMPNGRKNEEGFYEFALDFADTWHEEYQFAVQALGEEYFA